MRQFLIVFILFIFTTVISACSFYPEDKLSKEDVVIRTDITEGLNNFDRFVQHVQKGIKDKVRVIDYTNEVIYGFNFDGQMIEYVYDNSSNTKNDIQKTKCEGINVIKSAKGIEYKLIKCSEPNIGNTFYHLIRNEQ
jgi:hypothetical protein